jgi:hypothetical protein
VAGLWADINSKFGGTVVTANEIRDLVLGLEPIVVTASDQPDAQQVAVAQSKKRTARGLRRGEIPLIDLVLVAKLRDAIRNNNLDEVDRLLNVRRPQPDPIIIERPADNSEVVAHLREDLSALASSPPQSQPIVIVKPPNVTVNNIPPNATLKKTITRTEHGFEVVESVQ